MIQIQDTNTRLWYNCIDLYVTLYISRFLDFPTILGERDCDPSLGKRHTSPQAFSHMMASLRIPSTHTFLNQKTAHVYSNIAKPPSLRPPIRNVSCSFIHHFHQGNLQCINLLMEINGQNKNFKEMRKPHKTISLLEFLLPPLCFLGMYVRDGLHYHWSLPKVNWRSEWDQQNSISEVPNFVIISLLSLSKNKKGQQPFCPRVEDFLFFW